jgi:hypothetical protein
MGDVRGAVLTGAAIAAAAAAYVLSAQAGVSDGGRRTVLLAVGASLTGAVLLFQLLRARRDARRVATAAQIAVEAEEELGTALTGAFAPITGYLGEMAAARGRTRRAVIAGKLRQAVVEAGVLLTADDSRSAFYRSDPGGTLLTREAYAGRAALPRLEFRAGTRDGDTVLDLVRRGDLVFVEDCDVDPMITPTTPGTYRTVVAVAVTAGPLPLGLLTVDAPRVGDLSGTDVELVRVLANLLGAGLAQAQ